MSEPVLQELASALGVDAPESLQKLLERQWRGERYDAALPVLMRWLPEINHWAVTEMMVRLLGVPWGGDGVLEFLVSEFDATRPGKPASYRWLLGNSIADLKLKSLPPAVSRLALDSRYGSDREMLVFAMGFMRDDESLRVLIQLLADKEPSVLVYALRALRRRRAIDALDAVRRLLSHPEPKVRTVAAEAAASLSRQLARRDAGRQGVPAEQYSKPGRPHC